MAVSYTHLNQKTIDGYYIILDENGKPKMDAGGNTETTKYGPWTCISRSRCV